MNVFSFYLKRYLQYAEHEYQLGFRFLQESVLLVELLLLAFLTVICLNYFHSGQIDGGVIDRKVLSGRKAAIFKSEHVAGNESLDDALDDMIMICRNNGGILA